MRITSNKISTQKKQAAIFHANNYQMIQIINK